MAMYRITRFAASDMGKVGEFTETIRGTLERIGADFIDLISYGNGKESSLRNIRIRPQLTLHPAQPAAYLPK